MNRSKKCVFLKTYWLVLPNNIIENMVFNYKIVRNELCIYIYTHVHIHICMYTYNI